MVRKGLMVKRSSTFVYFAGSESFFSSLALCSCFFLKSSQYALSSAPLSHISNVNAANWLDSMGTPIGVQQKLMRHSDIRTTMNVYGDALTDDMRQAHEKVVRMAFS